MYGHNFVSEQYEFEIVRIFIYLGNLLNNENTLKKEIKSRKPTRKIFYLKIIIKANESKIIRKKK